LSTEIVTVKRLALATTVAVWPVRESGRLSYQGTRKVEAGNKAAKTSETLIGYTAC